MQLGVLMPDITHLAFTINYQMFPLSGQYCFIISVFIILFDFLFSLFLAFFVVFLLYDIAQVQALACGLHAYALSYVPFSSEISYNSYSVVLECNILILAGFNPGTLLLTRI